ncbi:MAG: hypothetical protein NDI61_09965 [Bdellovibrionaceae bacterium]|nr:hypothetical protein [Pseudobdellovibrionaceae bacterium]
MGEQLLMELIAATGLPQELVTSELNALIKKAGLDPARLSLEDIRLILAEYVQDVLLAAKTEFASAANE